MSLSSQVSAWRGALAVYFEPRVLAILFLGFSAGLPLALTGTTLSIRLKELGVDNTTIGAFALVGLPYTLKFLWAPAFDAVRLPWLGRRLGRRRSWLIATQAALFLSVLALGAQDAAGNPWLTAVLAIVVAFCSASQDVVIDAFRVESLATEENAPALVNYTFGYRIAMLTSGAGALFLAEAMQARLHDLAGGWMAAYAAMAVLLAVGVATVLAAPEPPQPAKLPEALAERFYATAVQPFLDFAHRPGFAAVLAFVMLYKFGDAFAGTMTGPFVLAIGFTKTDYATVVKVYGVAATLAGSVLGAMLARAIGNVRALWLCGLLQMASNLMFAWQATVGPSFPALVLTIGVENLTGGMGSVVFVVYLTELCANRAYTATQYALLSALATVGRTILSSPAGWFADRLDWVSFFVLSTVAALPGLMLLAWLRRRGWIEEGSRA